MENRKEYLAPERQQTTSGNIGAVTIAGFDPNKDVITFSNELTTVADATPGTAAQC